tara:strand:+ start:416 stop:706 length:291 start_codon:yes stop_codon:yes gene_type:complete
MINILTDNKSLKEFNNTEFLTHILQTSHIHQVATMKIIEEGIKVILKSKPELLKSYYKKQEDLKNTNRISIGFCIPTMIQVIEEIQTAFNLKYNNQ